MSISKVKHLFPGGNTAFGFHSFYDQIMAAEEADRFIIIKGGPGVGKSTFMKRLGEEMLGKGHDVEYLHCSSDNNSLDGVKIPALKLAIIDGTAPHVVDPKFPGAVDEILNFGEFWMEEDIRAHKAQLIGDSREISRLFQRAYRYLNAAYTIGREDEAIYQNAMNKGRLNLLVQELKDEVFAGCPLSEDVGGLRKMFASAITPDGFKNYLDSILAVDRVYELTGAMGGAAAQILEEIQRAAQERGYFVELYPCALNPDKPEHLVIPDLSVAFTTSNDYHTSTVGKHRSMDLKSLHDAGSLKLRQSELKSNLKHMNRLFKEAWRSISKAKALHDKLETFYVPNVDFMAINRFYDDTMERILE